MKWFYWSNVDSTDWATCVMWVVAEGGDVGCECWAYMIRISPPVGAVWIRFVLNQAC